jgi:hypothetical protein
MLGTKAELDEDVRDEDVDFASTPEKIASEAAA